MPVYKNEQKQNIDGALKAQKGWDEGDNKYDDEGGITQDTLKGRDADMGKAAGYFDSPAERMGYTETETHEGQRTRKNRTSYDRLMAERKAGGDESVNGRDVNDQQVNPSPLAGNEPETSEDISRGPKTVFPKSKNASGEEDYDRGGEIER